MESSIHTQHLYSPLMNIQYHTHLYMYVYHKSTPHSYILPHSLLYFNPTIHEQPMYANNYLCEWNIQPKDSCSRISLFIVDKDFHDPGTVSTNPSCDLSDHLELNYNSRQQNRYCGDAITNNCPFSNCILPQLSSGEDTP